MGPPGIPAPPGFISFLRQPVRKPRAIIAITAITGIWPDDRGRDQQFDKTRVGAMTDDFRKRRTRSALAGMDVTRAI
jgi:hypothetical protein